MDVAGTSFANSNERLWGGVGLGGSYNWDGDKYSIYGEGQLTPAWPNSVIVTATREISAFA